MGFDRDCHSCAMTGLGEAAPLAERIAGDRWWRVAHAFDTSLLGWLVLAPRRHVTTIAELTDEEAAALGPWQVRLSRALRTITGCERTYVAQFAEAAGFAHVHFHLVPRARDLPSKLRGPRVFDLLGRPAAEQVSVVEREAFAAELAGALRGD
jgi:diadenosine tetraphosphate (Ap4A) HIT family hydrolase